ncbi:MAG: PilN domain-containing protein [Deltaproteobacteria bacterium]|nr:PilN domain-containing protein [Deltaproteobacteria bacterium]
MIRINLLGTHEVRKEKKQQWLLKGTLLSYLTLVAAILVGFWIFNNQVKNFKKEKAALEIQTREALPLQKEIKELKDKREISQKRLTLLQDLEKDRHGPVRLMEHLSSILPIDQLWLTALKENGPEIRIDGMSLSNEILAEYMKRLESSSIIRQVDLIHSTQAAYKDLKVKQFALTAWTKPPAPSEVKK